MKEYNLRWHNELFTSGLVVKPECRAEAMARAKKMESFDLFYFNFYLKAQFCFLYFQGFFAALQKNCSNFDGIFFMESKIFYVEVNLFWNYIVSCLF